MFSLSNAQETNPTENPLYYRSEDKTRHVRQFILTISPESEAPPAVSNLLTSDPILYTSWAATVLYLPGEPPEGQKPVIFAKVSEIKDLVKNQPVTCAFAFYRMEKGALFQIFIQIDTPQIREKAQSPYIVEFTRNLDDADNCQLIQDLIRRDRLELCFVGPEPGGPCTGYFGLEFHLPNELKAALIQEFEDLQKYHRSMPHRNYEAALDQYNRENPLGVSPILPPTRSAAGQPAAKPTQPTLGLISQTALANALFIAILVVIAVVAFWLMTKEGAIFEFQPDERAKDMALWFPGLEVMVISLLVAAAWSWMFRIWSFIANYAACFLCLWGYQYFVFALGLNPVLSGIGCCLVVTFIFWVVSYIRTSRTEIPASPSGQKLSAETEVGSSGDLKVEPAPVEETLPDVEEQALVMAATQPPPAEPLPVDAPLPAAVSAPTAPPLAFQSRKPRVRSILLVTLALLMVFAIIIFVQAVLDGGDLLPAAGSGNPGYAPSGCRLWSEVSVADEGQAICVHGVVQRAYLGGEITYLRFSDDPDAFRLVDVNGVDYSAVVGQCVMTEGVIEVYGQMPYIEIGDQLDLCAR